MRIWSILILISIIFSMTLMSFAENNEVVAVVVSTPADAIVAAPYAKAMGYKLIYTPTNELSDDAKRELERYNINKVIIVGGPVAVSNNVENQIKKMNIDVKRVWGETRIETSIKMYELIKKERPDITKNIVVAEGSNEKIIPVAVSFDAPVIYYGLNRDNEVVDLLKTTKPEHIIILGKRVPKIITDTASKRARSAVIIASGSNDNIIKTALAYVPKINPKVENKDVAVVYAEKTNNPILDAVVSFVNGYVEAIIPIPTEKEDVINKIISKLTFASGVSVSSDSPSISNIISNTASKVGLHSTSVIVRSGGYRRGSSTVFSEGGSSSEDTTPVSEQPAIKIMANGKTIEFIGQENNTLSIVGTKTIDLPKIIADVNVVNKKDTSKNIEIYFKDNASVKSIVEAMNNYNIIAYNGDNITITYYNPDMVGKEISLYIIKERKNLRDDIRTLINTGDATPLIELLHSSYTQTKTVDSSGKATFEITANDEYSDYGVVIAEGEQIPLDATYMKILAIGGFEAPKYKLSIEKIGGNPITHEITFNISLNQTPENPVRFGSVLIKEGTNVNIKIDGTNPSDSLFNVSVVGDNGNYVVVENNDLIDLNASVINDIVGIIFKPETASATYSDITTSKNVELSLQNISDSYVIGIAYDTNNKRIVAINVTSLE